MKRSQQNRLSRRKFIQTSSVAAGSVILGAPAIVRGQNLNGKISLAAIGAGGKGASDIDNCARCGADIVALCDVDANTLAGRGEKYPRARKFSDFRKMLEKMDKSIDCVTVSTPDHMHAPASVMAMNMGKHVYCQKPLTQSVHEARVMKELASKKKLATQMGNQGSSEPGLRRAVEIIQAGVLGPVKELHVWSNRPIWPQGIPRPDGSDQVPKHLDWDLWLGVAPMRPYKKDVYHPFKWRGWQDFGTGALGDMACHTVNMPFRALKLGYPSVIEAEDFTEMNKETYPKSSRLRFEFPERDGMPPLKFWWSDGGQKPGEDVTREIITTMGKVPGSGCLVVGEKGKLFSPDDYGARSYIVMNNEAKYKGFQKHEAAEDVPETIWRSPGHNQEWFDMMKGGRPSYSNFDVAGYLTEIILLGCIAMRVGKKKIEWDGPNMKALNCPEAAQFVKRDYRGNYEI